MPACARVCVCVRSSRYLVAVKNLLVSNGIDSRTKKGEAGEAKKKQREAGRQGVSRKQAQNGRAGGGGG